MEFTIPEKHLLAGSSSLQTHHRKMNDDLKKEIPKECGLTVRMPKATVQPGNYYSGLYLCYNLH